MVNICDWTLVHTNTRLILSDEQQISTEDGYQGQIEQLWFSSARSPVF